MNRSPYLSCTHEFCETFFKQVVYTDRSPTKCICLALTYPKGSPSARRYHRTWLASALPFLLHPNRHYLDVIEVKSHRAVCSWEFYPLPLPSLNSFVITTCSEITRNTPVISYIHDYHKQPRNSKSLPSF